MIFGTHTLLWCANNLYLNFACQILKTIHIHPLSERIYDTGERYGFSVVARSKYWNSMALHDTGYYSANCANSFRMPKYLTSNSPIIKSYSSKAANLFSNCGTSSYKSDIKSLSLKSYNGDYSSSSYRSSPSSDNYYKSTTTKKSCQITSPSSSITSKYSPSSYRPTSSSPNTYVSRTVDSKVLDANANYRSDIDSSFSLPERKLSSLKRSELGSRKYLNDNLTNGYNANDLCKKDTDDKKDYLTGTYRKRYDKESSDDSSTKWAGLRNIGNTCFMNSILQCLSCTKLLKEYVMSRSYVKDINQDGKLISAFSNLITKIWSQSSGTVDVSAFKRRVPKAGAAVRRLRTT